SSRPGSPARSSRPGLRVRSSASPRTRSRAPTSPASSASGVPQVAPGFLEQRLIEVSDLVRHDLREVLDALARSDSAVAQRVIEADDEIDRLCLALDRDAEILLVGKVVPGRDIALVLAATRIARNLERMADQCVTIAKLVQAGGNDGPAANAVRESLEEMGRGGERMLEAAN